MPNQRSPDQTIMTASMPAGLVEMMDTLCVAQGISRSAFVRAAIERHLSSLGFDSARLNETPTRLRVDPAKVVDYREILKRRKTK